MARPQSTHWLRENAQERSPRRVLVIDTETMPASREDPDRQVLRLWAARYVRRHGIDPRQPRETNYRGRTAADLADLIESLARADAALWCMTHNLHFDLAVTALPVVLTERGWRVTEAAFTTEAPWARLARRSHHLTVADTFSWLPASVEYLGTLLGVRKLPLPDVNATEADWYARCERDVAITARAILSCMDWWDAGRLGNWSITGPASGWSTFRHRRPAPRVLVIPDPDARRFEMAAVTGGRREVRRLGILPDGLYADLDLSTAHLTAMSSIPLPAKRLGQFDSLPLDHRALASPAIDALAECVVSTDRPRYPWHTPRGVFYPTGTFRTVLAGPELREAKRLGHLVVINRGYLYLTSAHMADWALWLAGLLDPSRTDVPPAVRLLAKHWSRCVPGKWAGHTSDVIRRDPDPRPGWGVERAVLMPGARPADLLRVGGERWTIVRDEWADDAFPAILAFIQSATRVAVSRLIDQLEPALVSVNTDGILVDVGAAIAPDAPRSIIRDLSVTDALRALDARCQEADPLLRPFQVRIKRAASRVTVISPQHLILDRERRLSGIPKRHQRLADGRFTFTQWPKLRVQLQRDNQGDYRTREAAVDLAHVPPTGWLRTDGLVVPVVATPHDGADSIVSLTADLLADAGVLAPAARQHPLLRPLVHDPEPAP